MPLITVLIPTFNHTDTIRRAIASIQNQSLRDFELFVIGDGAPAETDRIMDELQSGDSRVRYFPNPKDKAQGEVYRHAALREANSDMVCYLSDDDLWLPNHLETMQALLREADFAHTLHVKVDVDGAIIAKGGSLSSIDVGRVVVAGVAEITIVAPRLAAPPAGTLERFAHVAAVA